MIVAEQNTPPPGGVTNGHAKFDAAFLRLWEECAAKLPDPAWAERDYIDGPGFVAWLEGQGVSGLYKLSSTRRWQAGGEVSYWAADKLVLKHGLHLKDIPDQLWIKKEK